VTYLQTKVRYKGVGFRMGSWSKQHQRYQQQGYRHHD
jgi:hypothetical protein